MGFVEDNIMDGENIIYRAKLHKIIFLLPGIFAVPFLLGAIAALSSAFLAPHSRNTLLGFVGVLSNLIIAIIIGIIPLIYYRTSEFAVTNKRVLAKYGFIRRRSTEIFLTKIEGIVIDQSILGRSLGYGTVIISGTGSLKNHFKKISNPLEFRKKVQNQISSLN